MQLYTDLFLANCPDMIFLLNEQLRVIACSETCLPLLCIAERASAAGKPLTDIFSRDFDDSWVRDINRRNEAVMSDRLQCRFDDAIMLRGAVMHVQVSIAPMLDKCGACHGTIMTVKDITELVESKRRAEEASRSKSSFLANMSHEIRTPMNAVKGLSELLALTELSSLQRNYIKNIISSANSLLGIINDILDFSKIDANKIEYIEGPYNLPSLITGVCNVVSVRADDKNLLMLIDVPPDLPATLFGDDARIRQVITNLLSNAVKYTNEGYVRFSVCTEERGGVTWLCIKVEDSGIGIRQEDMPYLFNAFSRADLRANRSVAGTGLGLAIAKQLAVAMGGDIAVDSTYGKGSVFTFRLPQKVMDMCPIAAVDDPGSKQALLLGTGERMRNLIGMLGSLSVPYTHIETQDALDAAGLGGYTHCVADETFSERVMRLLYSRMPLCLFAALKNIREAMSVADYQDTILYLPLFISELASFLNRKDRDAPGAARPEPADERLTLSGVTALVVDDNDINLIVGSETLRTFGAEVVCAKSGEEALRLCAEQAFDIIFMDHMMPGKDGIETTMEIRKGGGPNSETPIVALTANVVNDMESVYLASGMDDFIGKPMEIADMYRTLRKWLPKEKLGAGGAPSSPGGLEAGAPPMTPGELIAAFDNFGLYSSDVMREMNGDFKGYIARMEDASKVLGGIVASLKADVSEKRWDDFSRDCLSLHAVLYGIGARGCAGRALKLAHAGRERNVEYIHEDFYSLIANMYMLDKKLVVIVPFARGEDAEHLPLGSMQYLHGCLDKMGRALALGDAVETMALLESAASFSLDMDLDMALNAIKADLELGDFQRAAAHHKAIFRSYTERLAVL